MHQKPFSKRSVFLFLSITPTRRVHMRRCPFIALACTISEYVLLLILTFLDYEFLEL